ncbi:hypothetical protein [Parafrankia elaeagni]|uniref:hypothetical protein n=1 Tax=Parafrankia elaeagni TaxID=222534 RepID=UPI0003A5DB67|nr:hypothetical protein [Parafrankia elaeagni]
MTQATQSAQGRRGSPGLALAVLCAGQMLIVLEQNIVNVALPDLQRGLGFSSANLVWVVNAYLVPFGGLLMLAGRLGDLVGRRNRARRRRPSPPTASPPPPAPRWAHRSAGRSRTSPAGTGSSSSTHRSASR